jgi:hypothetical protein
MKLDTCRWRNWVRQLRPLLHLRKTKNKATALKIIALGVDKRTAGMGRVQLPKPATSSTARQY